MAIAIMATGFGGPDKLSAIERAVPAPGAGEVTVAVRAAAINPIDRKLYSGEFGADPDDLPMPLGLEVAGVVTATGPDAAGQLGPIAVGDDVLAYWVTGGYATEVTAAAEHVLPRPSTLDWAQASGLMLTGVTAVHALTATSLAAGETVLIHGVAGGVGLAAAQLALRRGATVIGTAAAHRHEWLRGYGIRPVGYGPGLADRVRELADGGVHAAFEFVGTDEAVDTSLELVADRQRVVTIVAFDRAMRDGFRSLGGGPGAEEGKEIRAGAWRELYPLAADGALDVVVSRTFPLADAAAAHEFVAEGHAGGKVVLLTS